MVPSRAGAGLEPAQIVLRFLIIFLNVTKPFRGKGELSGPISKKSDPANIIAIYWGGPLLVNRYDPALLRETDIARAASVRSRRAQNEWQTSRALLQALPAQAGIAVALTHKLGHAAVACAPAGWQIGIDLEMAGARDVARLAPWMAAPHEIDALSSLAPEPALRHFYRLWTFKEAMIKARGQDFPADLKQNTLAVDPVTHAWRVHTPGQDGWSLRIFETLPGWVLAVVWRTPAGQHAEIEWHIESDATEDTFQLEVCCDGENAPPG